MIIDTHVHIDKLLFTMTESMVIEAMEKYNIKYAIVSNCACCEFDHQLNKIDESYQTSQIDSLKEILSFARSHPDKIGVSVWIKPHSETLTDELKKLIEDNLDIIYGLKLHPYHNQVSINDDRLNPYIEFAIKHNLPFSIHTSSDEMSNPKEVYKAALKYPECKFIMVHMGLGTDNQEAIDYLEKCNNLYADTTWVSVKSTLEAIKRCGSDRILFGSDAPVDGVDTYYCNGAGQRSLYQEYFNEFKELVSLDEYQKIMYKNAIKLFNLDKAGKTYGNFN